MNKGYLTKLYHIDKQYFLSTNLNGDYILMITLFDQLDYYQRVNNKWILISRQVKLFDKWNLRVFQLSIDGKKFACLTQKCQIQYYIYCKKKGYWILTKKHQLADWGLLKSLPYLFYVSNTLDFWYTKATLPILEDSFEVSLFSQIYQSKRLKRYIINGNQLVQNSISKYIATQVKNKIYVYKFYSSQQQALFNVKHKISGFFIKECNLLIHCSTKLLVYSIQKKQQLFFIDLSMIKVNKDQSLIFSSKGIIILQHGQHNVYILYLNETETSIVQVKPIHLMDNCFFACQTGEIYIIQEQDRKDCYRFTYKIYTT